MSKKILVVTPYERDPNSFWRCLGPLNYLQKHSHDQIELVRTTDKGTSWCDIMGVDLVFMHRPCRRDDLTIMQIAYQCDVPVWVDYDDWLFHIPGWNPNAGYYNSDVTQNYVAQILSCADVVTVSTQALCDQFKLVNPNVVLVPNAYRSDLFSYRNEQLQERQKVGYWRGSNTHDGDLLSVREGFQELRHPIHFLGGGSWLLLSGMKPQSYQIKASLDFLMFFRYIYDLRPKVMVFPLVDCFFNQCKSNIAYIEALHAGAICVAPEMYEWKKEGVITYKPHDSDSFRNAVNDAFDLTESIHQEMVYHAYSSMKAEYDIQVINGIRKQIVSSLSEKKNVENPFDQVLGLHAMTILKGKADGSPKQLHQE